MSSPSLDLSTVEGAKAYLTSTPFASDRIALLSGGNTNFIFRVHLLTAYEGQPTVILKHSSSSLPGGLLLPLARQQYEVEALRRVSGWLPADAPVRAPRVYHFDKDAAAVVMEDCGTTAKPLKEAMILNSISLDNARYIGNALGEFLAKLHGWRSGWRGDHVQVFAKHQWAKDIAAWVTYGRLVSTLNGEADGVPALRDPGLDMSKEDLEAIRQTAETVSENMKSANETFVMGDFWPGNIVVDLQGDKVKTILVVDWELVRTGVPELDVGQFCAETHSLSHFYPGTLCAEAAVEAQSAFLGAYKRGSVPSVEMASAVAVHIGAHLVAWTPRVAWGGKEETRAAVLVGARYLVEGARRSHDWLRTSLVAPLVPT
ncbi:hypothetical protein HGRIS_008352 [Hohenbuehelia grisea]|uniref:Aminoglycoside phosphotransferase domain-containing protein n=1 Tax=Hohenbuehelia grisea TaxID=104357 RepID=A0ABR3J861_9AGAR